jgi:hypothetical protein
MAGRAFVAWQDANSRLYPSITGPALLAGDPNARQMQSPTFLICPLEEWQYHILAIQATRTGRQLTASN